MTKIFRYPTNLGYNTYYFSTHGTGFDFFPVDFEVTLELFPLLSPNFPDFKKACIADDTLVKETKKITDDKSILTENHCRQISIGSS